VQVIE
jgi:hypothetical protein